MEISTQLRTLSKTPFFSSTASPLPLPSHLATTRLRLPAPTVVAAETRLPLSSAAAAALLSTDPRRGDDVLSAALDSLSNCLSETYLNETVHGLRLKARGNMSSTATFLFGF